MTPEQRFRAYMDAFNRSDYDALCGFYAPDIRLVIGNGTELVGRQAIVDFYRPVKAVTQRTIDVLQCFHDGKVLAAELESEFLALEDLPDFVSGPMNKGDRRYLNSLVLYDFEGEHYTRIRAAILKREYRPAS
ncbi:nuclear transport factor 2 family protein [Novosphingobium sp. EMRT-2]|uniref:nuclear transport factor 2 family protein n=1 Tax=Novosphingobium sp. EMRT-2 TaxID=2571749 RepID=UPI0010BD6344|nr:nuclear transport factor 2 family protein [Novosphingobium sp. EMRT-2]QCI95807.1 nuclear transport factor 2 family protein [Novosphingobium sp. EMRT-2]